MSTSNEQMTASIAAAGTISALPSLAQQRAAALADFERLGFPTQRLENWKYTDVKRLAAAYPEWLGNPTGTADVAVPELDVPDAAHLVFVDGAYSAALSQGTDFGDGVVCGSLTELEQSSPGLIQDLFGALAQPADSGFIALNAALAGHGAALIVPAGVDLSRPCVVTYVSTTAQTIAQPRLLVSLGKNSRATVIEHFCSTATALINAVAELRCGSGAHLDYYKLQAEAAQVWHTAAQYVAVGRDARFSATHVDIGSDLARNELKVQLAEPGAHAETKGLMLADGSRHVESRVRVEHLAPHTTSRERYRSILGGSARGVFNGSIYVAEDAQKTSAALSNRNLLLSKGAEINTKPELEIYADDVKCAHGSTTGQLDETSLFYLRTRGVDDATARKMLITAFAAELLTDIAIPAIATAAQRGLESVRGERIGELAADSTSEALLE